MEIIYPIALVLMYFLPAFIASGRKHLNANPIILVNLFFGWTIVGWIVSLVWATTANTDLNRRRYHYAPPPASSADFPPPPPRSIFGGAKTYWPAEAMKPVEKISSDNKKAST